MFKLPSVMIKELFCNFVKQKHRKGKESSGVINPPFERQEKESLFNFQKKIVSK